MRRDVTLYARTHSEGHQGMFVICINGMHKAHAVQASSFYFHRTSKSATVTLVAQVVVVTIDVHLKQTILSHINKSYVLGFAKEKGNRIKVTAAATYVHSP